MERTLSGLLPGRDDVYLIAHNIGQVVGLCCEYSLDATGKVQGVYAVCKSHSLVFLRHQFTNFMLEFKVFGSFHASSRRPTFETPTKSKSKFEILSGYRGRTPLSVVVNRCLTGRPSGGIQA